MRQPPASASRRCRRPRPGRVQAYSIRAAFSAARLALPAAESFSGSPGSPACWPCSAFRHSPARRSPHGCGQNRGETAYVAAGRLVRPIRNGSIDPFPRPDLTEAFVAKADTVFSGSIPALYDKYLGPLIFEPYAEDLAQRLSALDAARVLEAAAGTGIVTRALVGALPGS